MFKFFDKFDYSFIFWLYFALITVAFREYYLEEKLTVYNIFPTSIDTLFSILFALFVVYTLFIFILILRKSKTSQGNKFFLFFGNLVVTLHLIYTVSQTYNLSNITILKDYHVTSQINELRQTLPIPVNGFTTLVDISSQNSEIKYVYQLNKSKDDIASIDLKSFKEGIQDSLCNEAYSLDVLKYNYTLNYNYLDKDNNSIANIKTKKEDCGESIYDLDYLKLILMDKKI